MYRRNNRPSPRWFWVPIIVIVSLFAIGIAVSLYLHSIALSVYPFWFPFPFFFFIPVVFLFFFGLRWFFWGGWGCGWSGRQYYEPAFETLRERYAKGEITREQLEQMTRDLEQN